MPVYEYECSACGVFTAVAGLARYQEPARCPRCGEPAPRIMSAPALRRLSEPIVRALSRAERSRSEPQVVSAATPSRHRASAPGGGRPWMISH